MRSRYRVAIETLETRQLMSAAVGPTALTTAAGATAGEIPAQTFNVKNYGAKGDGASDDQPAIQAAIAAMKSNGGGTLVFPFGTYRISRSVRIEYASRFIVSAAGAVLKPLDNVTGTSIEGDVLELTECQTFTVFGLRLDGNESRRGPGFPALSMRLEGAVDFRITDCVFVDSTLDDLYFNSSRNRTTMSHDGVITDCTFQGARRAAIAVSQAYNIEFTNNEISQVRGTYPASGIVFESDAGDADYGIHDILVNRNTFMEIAEAGVSVIQTAHPRRITVDSNVFLECPTGVRILSDQCVVSNNYFAGGRPTTTGSHMAAIGQITVASYAGTKVTIEGNQIVDVTGMSAIYIHPSWTGEAAVTNNRISGVSGKYVAIYVASDNARVTGNGIDRADYIGIGVLGNNASIGANLLTNGAHAAIYYTGSGGWIWLNTMINYGIPNAGYCILTSGGAVGCLIDSNVIRNWNVKGWIGIKADSSDVLMNNSLQLLR